jgi:GNAT superfamily N-acetyltransferase
VTEIDWWPLERLDELQTFIDREWRAGHVLGRDQELLRWQHRRRGDAERLAVLAAREGGAPVAILGFVEFDACTEGGRLRGGWMTTWLTVPHARGRGLGATLVEHVRGSEYDLIGALDANSATTHALRKLGFVTRPMARWVDVADAEAIGQLLGRTRSPAAPSPPQQGSLPRFTGACRDDEFRRWRYREHPRFEYGLVEDDSGFAAFRLEQVRDSEVQAMRLVDFLGGATLAQRIRDTADREGVAFTDFSCTSPSYAVELERVGFTRDDTFPRRFQPLEAAEAPPVCCFWAGPSTDVDVAGTDLYVTRADSDLDRPN